MAKKYETPNNETQKAVEPSTTDAAITGLELKKRLHESLKIKFPSLQCSLEELKDRISDGIEKYHQGEYYTQDEAHTLINSWISRV